MARTSAGGTTNYTDTRATNYPSAFTGSRCREAKAEGKRLKAENKKCRQDFSTEASEGNEGKEENRERFVCFCGIRRPMCGIE